MKYKTELTWAIHFKSTIISLTAAERSHDLNGERTLPQASVSGERFDQLKARGSGGRETRAELDRTRAVRFRGEEEKGTKRNHEEEERKSNLHRQSFKAGLPAASFA